jgi:two-component system NtrC family sensor kinase
MPWRVSVRGYFLAIIALALLAAVVLVVDLTAQQRRQLTTAAGQDALQVARLAAGAHQHTVSETQRTLELLARMPAVRSGEGCAALLAELRRRMPGYLDLGVAGPQGEVICGAQLTGGRRSVADRAWFRTAAEWRQLGVGEYRVERATGRPAVTVALPLLDHRGRMSGGVLFAVVDLAWLGELSTQANLPPDATLALIDRDGFVLARHPPMETARLDGRLVEMLSRAGSGVLESAALGGSPRLVGFTRAGSADTGGAFVMVAVPAPSMVAAGRALGDGVAWIALIGVLGLIAAVIGSEMLLRRRIEHLVATTRRLAAGDFSARTGWQDTRSELGQVAQAFDEMASAVERLTRRTQLILEAVSEAILGVDGDERVTFVNPVAATLLGVPVTDLVGRPLHGVLREAAAAVGERCPLCEALDGGTPQQSTDGLLTRPDGAVVPVEYTCTPKRERWRAAGAVVALKDISRRKRAEQDRQRRRDMLHQRDKLASMATLLADVAHELNNPLTVIIAGSTLLRDATRDEGVRRRAELLEQAAERCALTIRNFLALVRQYPATREEVALERIVKETLALVAYQLEVDEISVDIELPRETPPVWADPHQLHQVLLNLVTNARHALRATPPPRQLSIGVHHDVEARRVALEVTDSGPGVPPELRGFVFRPFFTTKSPEEGTGLGLALCHDIVAAHGGTIRVDSAPGGGALFVVELPLELPEEIPAPPAPVAVQPPRQGRVLVVDDDLELAGVLAAALRGVGHQVEVAPNGVDALDLLRRGPFDVILTDVRMPKLDGPGLYREIQQHHPELIDRVVFVTGDILGRETAAFLERTRAAHLTKPFDIKQVRRLVADVLDR